MQRKKSYKSMLEASAKKKTGRGRTYNLRPMFLGPFRPNVLSGNQGNLLGPIFLFYHLFYHLSSQTL